MTAAGAHTDRRPATCPTCGHVDSIASDKRSARVTRQLELLALRAASLADRVATGDLEFVEAVDLAYSAAVWAGLPEAIEKSGLIDTARITGDDVIQAILAAAFDTARPPA